MCGVFPASITRRVAPSYAAPSLPGRGGPYCSPHFSLVNGRIRVSTKFPRYCGSGNYLHAHMAASHQQPVAQSARHPSPHTSVRRRAFTHYCHFVFFFAVFRRRFRDAHGTCGYPSFRRLAFKPPRRRGRVHTLCALTIFFRPFVCFRPWERPDRSRPDRAAGQSALLRAGARLSAAGVCFGFTPQSPFPPLSH
jgi:hypothetical protein